MSKAILILDEMPITCDECPLFVKIFGHSAFCPLGAKYSDEEIEAVKHGTQHIYYHGCLYHRPKECPLKAEGGEE